MVAGAAEVGGIVRWRSVCSRWRSHERRRGIGGSFRSDRSRSRLRCHRDLRRAERGMGRGPRAPRVQLSRRSTRRGASTSNSTRSPATVIVVRRHYDLGSGAEFGAALRARGGPLLPRLALEAEAVASRTALLSPSLASCSPASRRRRWRRKKRLTTPMRQGRGHRMRRTRPRPSQWPALLPRLGSRATTSHSYRAS
jgi:hypothetical protein